MLAVPIQYHIRNKRELERCSIQEIATTMNVDWRTAKKYADRTDWSEQVVSQRRKPSILSPFHELIDSWMEEDERLPRKQRRSSVRIFNLLRDTHDYHGKYRTVAAYIERKRLIERIEHIKGSERLVHQPCEAQVDFGTVHVIEGGELVERKQLTISFPYSNAAYGCPMPSENAECFLEALGRMFQWCGGVPKSIWFDNLSAAVVAVQKRGERQLTEVFQKFVSHYRFQAIFCNPASGNEKGHVEGKVGYTRRNWCSPPPTVDSLEQLESFLKREAEADMNRPHYEKGMSISTLFNEEREQFLALPSAPFLAERHEKTRLNGYRELQFDKYSLPLPQAKPRQKVQLRIRWNEIDVCADDGDWTLIATIPRPYTKKMHPIDWHAVFSGFKKRPRVIGHSAFRSLLPESTRMWLDIEEIEIRIRRIDAIIGWLKQHSIETIGEALAEYVASNDSHSTERVTQRLLALSYPIPKPEPFLETHTPASFQGDQPDLSAYNQFSRGCLSDDRNIARHL